MVQPSCFYAIELHAVKTATRLSSASLASSNAPRTCSEPVVWPLDSMTPALDDLKPQPPANLEHESLYKPGLLRQIVFLARILEVALPSIP